MKYTLTRKTTKPSRGYESDAGIDIYVPEFNTKFIQHFMLMNKSSSFKFNFNSEPKLIIIHAHQRIKVPSGVHFNIPENNMLLVLQKSSIPSNTGILGGARVIDQTYQGQFIGSLINTSNTDTYLKEGQKFIQLVLVPINYDKELEYIENKQQLYENITLRNIGGFGSTGEK